MVIFHVASENIQEKKQFIMDELRKKGFRITSQRKTLIDVILKNECSCNKEIYYLALQRDSSVSMATVYRMVKTLEELGAIDRRNMYKITCEEVHSMGIPSENWMDKLKNVLGQQGMLGEDEEIFVRIHKKGSKEAIRALEQEDCSSSCCGECCRKTI